MNKKICVNAFKRKESKKLKIISVQSKLKIYLSFILYIIKIVFNFYQIINKRNLFLFFYFIHLKVVFSEGVSG